MSRRNPSSALPWLATLSAEDLKVLFARARARHSQPPRLRARSSDAAAPRRGKLVAW